MEYEVRIMPEAYSALSRNAIWWADHHSASQASQWYDAFIQKLHTLKEMPASHPFAEENSKTSYELRELHFSLGRRTSHRALFRVSGNSVEVLTIQHVAQDELSVEDLN